MPKRIEYEGEIHEFPDDFTDADIATALGGSRPQAAPAPPQVNLTQAPFDVLRGVAKGAGSTLAHTADMVQRMAGTPRILESPQVQSLITPTNPYENFGYGVEQAGEFMLPGGLVRRGTQAVEAATAGARGSTLFNLAARSGLEGMTAGGVAGLQTGGNQQAMEDAALTGAGITAGTGAASAAVPTIARRLERGGQRTYEQVLNPTKEKFKYVAQEKVIPELIKRGELGGTLEGMKAKFSSRVQQFGQQLDDAYAALPPGSAVELQPVLQAMDDSIAPMYTTTSRGRVTKGPLADEAIRDTETLKQVLINHHEINPQTGAMEIPVDRIRALRQHFDEVASRAGAFHGKTLSEANFARAYEHAGNAIRAELAKPYPDIAKINKEYSFWKNAADVTDATILRRVGQAKPLGRQLAAATAGAVTGSVAGLLGDSASGMFVAGAVGAKAGDMLLTAVQSPAWRTVSAVTKDRLAKALATGNRGAVEFYLRQITKAIAGSRITIPTSKELPAPRLASAPEPGGGSATDEY